METDTLILTDVFANDIKLSRQSSSDNMLVKILSTGEIITIHNQMLDRTKGLGIEAIRFADGTMWDLDRIKSETSIQGADTINDNMGRGNYDENMYGGGGNDTITGSAGDDYLIGEAGADLLKGAAGNDTYIWSRGDGADTIDDNADSTTDVDRLVLTGVVSDDVTLFDTGPGRDIVVRVNGANGADILIKDRDYEVSGVRQGRGIEVIEFGDGSVWTLEDIMYRGTWTGNINGNVTTGTAFEDHYIGSGGNDTLASKEGNDTLDGGADNDSLTGGAGSDTYIWRLNDGNDTINDDSIILGEADVLVLENVNSSQVSLAHHGDNHLRVQVGGETLLILNEFEGTTGGKKGIEVIRFADGVEWTQADIWTRTWRIDDNVGRVVNGTSLIDNIRGMGGNDTINAGLGDDLLVGGTGHDSLRGEAGNDRYEWSVGQGNDTINDHIASLTDVDTLALLGVASTEASFARVGVNLEITIGAEKITIIDRFNTAADGKGIEKIEFSDVVYTISSGPDAMIVRPGTGNPETLTGWNYRDSMTGGDGNDTLVGNGGDDTLYGGNGIDMMQGGLGSDTYIKLKNETNDYAYDVTSNEGDIDTLWLADTYSTDVKLMRWETGDQFSDDLRVRIISTNELVHVHDRFQATGNKGIERIVFFDGVVWDLDEIFRRTMFEGTSSAETLNGTAVQDNIFGYAGNDTVNGGDGDDTITGGAGNDLLKGGGHADTYVWTPGDGNDTIDDVSTSFATLDVLRLTDVAQSQVTLTHAASSNHLVITIVSTSGTEVITVNNRFQTVATPFGVERIEFEDGSYWNLDEILRQTMMNGTAAANTLTGNGYADNMFGLGGNDTLNAGDGNDTLTGGLGTDSLVGGNGSDSYHWSRDTLAGWNDGNDIINDAATSLTDVDTLYLHGIAASAVDLQRWAATNDLNVKFGSVATNDAVEIRILGQMANAANHVGIEKIVFDDGTVWTYDDIMNNVATNGTDNVDTITGTAFNDKIWAGAAWDVVNGGAGNDLIVGGTGQDTINGGTGIDTSSYTGSNKAVVIDLALTTGQTGGTGYYDVGDVLQGIENVWGSDLAEFGDIIYGNAEANEIRGYKGNDYLNGRDGSDILKGGNGIDTIYGGNGNDYISGDHSNDLLYGDAGDDTIIGGNHVDTIYGGDGNDLIIGNRDGDLIDGGAGADEFRYAFEPEGNGHDIISNYEDDVDFISYSFALADEFSDLVITGNGTTSVTVTFVSGAVTLNAATAINLTAEDFVFY